MANFCVRCGSRLNEGRCENCGYIEEAPQSAAVPKKNTGKILIISGIAVAAIIAIVVGILIIMNVRKGMCLTPKDAVATYFEGLEDDMDINGEIFGAEKTNEAANDLVETILDTVDYTIISVDEEADEATVNVQIRSVDLDYIADLAEKMYGSSSNFSFDERMDRIEEIVDDNEDKTKVEMLEMYLVKNGDRWEVSDSTKYSVKSTIFR